jgi:hypothetical protein
MASITLTSSKGARLADNGSNMGAGASDFHPFGTYSGYTYRTLIGFSTPAWSTWTAITKATLYCRNSTQYYVAFGSSPSCYIDLITGSWSEGSSVGLSTGNSVVYPGPAASTTNRVSKNTGDTEQNWWSADVTAMLRQAWNNGAGTFQGLRLIAQSTSAADVGEIYSDDTSSEPYLVIEYETNRVPNAPTPSAPATGLLTDLTPDFAFTASDPDVGNTLKNYDIQVATDAAFASLVWNLSLATAGISGWAVSGVTYAGAALTPGTTYHWRARVRDQNDAVSAYSATRTFTINKTPEVVGADLPYGGANHVAPIHNLADLVTTLTPKPQFVFTPRSAVGSTITEYQIEVQTNAGGAVATETVAGSFASGAAITRNFGTALTNLATYKVRFRARDAIEGYGPWSAFVVFAVKYAQVIYQFNIPSANNLSAATVLGAGKAQVLYRTATGAAGAGASAWSANVPPTVTAYLNVMVRTASEGSAPAQPKVTSFTLNYQQSLVLPYSWTFVGSWSLDSNVRRYGIKSIALDATASPAGADRLIYQDVPNLTPETDYAISAWVLIENYVTGNVRAMLLPSGSTNPASALASVTISRNTVGWERIVVPYKTIAGQTSLRFAIFAAKEVVTPTEVHIDAAMLSEGPVAPVWTPALTGTPVIVDAQGLLIDGTAGAIFRVTGSAGGARDIIEMGARGFIYGGDTGFYSPYDKLMRMTSGGALSGEGVQSSGSGAATNGYWAKLASGSLTAQFQSVDVACLIGGSSGTGGYSHKGLLALTISQQNAFGSDPLVGMKLLTSDAAFGPEDVVLVVTSNAGPTNYELWVRASQTFQSVWMQTLHLIGSDSWWVPVSGFPLQAAIGAGTQFPADPFGSQPIRRVYTTLGANTWTKPPGLSHIEVEVQGGGGGGGGAAATGAGAAAQGTCGGGGGYARKLFRADELPASCTATVGAGGTAGAAGANAGGTGGASTFAGTGITTVQGNGGPGGPGGAADTGVQRTTGAAGGGASGGDVNIPGGEGSGTTVHAGNYTIAGAAGNSVLGHGGYVSGSTARAGGLYGGGASGGTNTASQAARAGAAGGQGVIIVTEYYH